MLDAVKNRGVLKQYLRNINVRWFGFDLSDLRSMRIPLEESDELSVRNGDLFICEGGEPGRCAVWRLGDNDLVYQKALHRVRPLDGLIPEFLMYQLRHHADAGALSAAFTGTTIKHLTRQSLAGYEVGIPPEREQLRIADKLDAVLTRVDACRERLDRVPNILKRFRQAVLAAATTGTLTEDWRDECGIGKDSWVSKEGRNVFAFVTSGSRGWARYYSDAGPLFLRVGNLDHDTIELDLRHVQRVNPPMGAEGERTRIQAGDILISITADVGMVGFVREGLVEAYINQHLCLARQTGNFSGAYLAYFLASPTGGFLQAKEAQRGATKAGLTLEDIRCLEILVPSLSEQHEIVRRIESLFAVADRLEARYTAARAQVERLTPALLAKAFRGELVPQDPNDEPAAVLLARIRAARAAAPAKPRGRNGATGSRTAKKRLELAMLSRKDIQDTHLTNILKERGPLTAESLWSASQLQIDEFYDQLKDEETRGLLRENRNESAHAPRMLEAVA